MENAGKRCLAELIGTFTLVFVGTASVCMGVQGDMLGALDVAVAHGLALAVMISALGAISGGHFNPAVTFGFLVTGRIPASLAGRYAISQILGATIAGFLVKIVFADVWLDVVQETRLVSVDAGVTMGTAILVEAILTFLLVTVVFGTAVDPRRPNVGGFAIGLTVAANILACGTLTGASMNPARTLGLALVAGFWEGHHVYWIGPLLGGALGALLYHHLLMEKGR
jgi:MIP family channel proteins